MVRTFNFSHPRLLVRRMGVHACVAVIRIPLQDKSETIGMKARRKRVLEEWDRQRQKDGQGKWEVIYCSLNAKTSTADHSITLTFIKLSISIDTKTLGTDEYLINEVLPQIRQSASIHIPIVSLSPRPLAPHTDEIEDWNENMNDLFEWVGMACLGAQR